MFRKNKIFIITAIAGISNFIATAQDNQIHPMITDRPDATESPTVVPLHTLQIETGGAYKEFEDGPFKLTETVYNTTLLRYGLFKTMELRLGWDVLNADNGVTSETGLNPILMGAKIGIVEENGLLPEIGFLGHIYHSFAAAEAFETETTGTDFRFSFAHTLSEKSAIAYNLGMEWRDDNPEGAYVYTLSYGLSLTEKIGFYAELYGNLPESSSPNHLWDAGFTYLAKPLIQFDATVGTGINTNQKLLVSMGVSIRLPR